MDKFAGTGAQILGISTNRPSTNLAFAQKLGVSFPLLSDTEKKVCRQYGVLNFFRLSNRATFVVDKQGVIRHIDRGPAAADPAGAQQACMQLGGRQS